MILNFAHNYRQFIKPVEIVFCVLFIWFGVLAGLVYAFDFHGKLLVIGSPPEIMSKLDGDVRILRIDDYSIVLSSDVPDFTKRLYGAGAVLVMPAIEAGCLDLRFGTIKPQV